MDAGNRDFELFASTRICWLLISRVALNKALTWMVAIGSPPVSGLSAFIAISKRGFVRPAR